METIGKLHNDDQRQDDVEAHLSKEGVAAGLAAAALIAPAARAMPIDPVHGSGGEAAQVSRAPQRAQAPKAKAKKGKRVAVKKSGPVPRRGWPLDP